MDFEKEVSALSRSVSIVISPMLAKKVRVLVFLGIFLACVKEHVFAEMRQTGDSITEASNSDIHGSSANGSSRIGYEEDTEIVVKLDRLILPHVVWRLENRPEDREGGWLWDEGEAEANRQHNAAERYQSRNHCPHHAERSARRTCEDTFGNAQADLCGVEVRFLV